MKRASALIFCCLFACLLASASVVQAGGFALYEWSQRGIAMATTGYAQAGDASVIATNPALMTKLEGKHVLVGATLIAPQTSVYLDGSENKTKAKVFTVPHAYYTQQMESNENVWLGVGLFTRFGLGTYYDDTWAGKSSLQYVDVKSVSLNPNIAFKFSDDLSVAAGIEILKGSFDLQKDLSGIGRSIISFHTSGYGVGGNIGMSYDINDEWSAGLTWRAPMKLYTTGSADYSWANISSEDGQEISATLPGSYTLAFAYEPTDDWVFEFDLIHTRWEATKAISYDGSISSTTQLNYKNTWRGQLGAEYWTTDWLAVRLGYAYDQTPTRAGDASFMLPANDRHLFSTGLGYKMNNWKIDWSFMYVVTKERKGLGISDGAGSNWTVDFKGGKTWITGMSVGYEF
ncbi:outer membrane protein transport protein [Pseudodesulfovibrio sp.]|nr:outer membrane protein transport protein [Pseudodesulfovibrio sp.]